MFVGFGAKSLPQDEIVHGRSFMLASITALKIYNLHIRHKSESVPANAQRKDGYPTYHIRAALAYSHLHPSDQQVSRKFRKCANSFTKVSKNI